jgi:hypothetical protein
MKDKLRNYQLKPGKIANHYRGIYPLRIQQKDDHIAEPDDVLEKTKNIVEEVKFVFRDAKKIPERYKENILHLLTDRFTIDLRDTDEEAREENVVETHQQGHERVQAATKRRCPTKKIDETGEEMKKSKHEAKESKAYERKEEKEVREDKKETKSKKK